MPLVTSSYLAPFVMRSPYVSSIYPAVFRDVDYPPKSEGGDALIRRERIETEDGDFLDIDVYPSPRQVRFAVVLTHGLGGNSRRRYVRGMARALASIGAQVFAWNERGCSEEINRTGRYTHMADTVDLARVVSHVEGRGLPIALVGFSMGAHQSLIYLSRREEVSKLVVGGAFVSDPCDLIAAVPFIDGPGNRVFLKHLLDSIIPRMKEKGKKFPELLKGVDIDSIKSFLEFDNTFTAPAFGFKDARDYWRRASDTYAIPLIRHPVFLLNSADDPFCDPGKHPVEQGRRSRSFFFELSRYGGHVGFATSSGPYYSERRVCRFLEEKLLN